ncbi:MAG: AMP-binding enzyme family protein 21 [Achromobacter mucicolens]|jgi:acyl-CoA synthetase (AMP-forming)/AMP-acid ligase II|uniref:class I adenylate-forming enzyme family protein n=1 Tax=Achromobacter mucicolens TaxID=1389922 RepID=UPI002430A629|nr:class I adenylate-forming enzyme family protein [Achromobacter mucicolens]MDF2860613.1 AMP-binding enzyme family protein 21 [Achromobacter mucicolens]
MSIADATVVAAFARLWDQPEWAARHALVTAEESVTYADLRRRVGQAAGGLRAAGVAPGDYVGVAMERSLAQVLAILGVMAAGACPCPLEPRLSVEETARRVAAVGLSWMLADSDNADTARGCGLPAARVLDAAKIAQGGQDWSGADVAPAAPGLLLFTSGSTGSPKGVLLSHRGIVNNARGVLAHTGLTPGDRLLHVMPLHHTNALNNQIFTPLLAGASVALAGRFRAQDMPGLLAAFRPTIITGVPTMYARMLELTFDPDSLAGLRFARCGSAPITETLHRRIEAFLGCPLVVSYGLSEATCTSTMNPPAARRVGSVGTVLEGQDVSLRLPDGSLAPAGADGEICIAGDSLMLGYLGVDSADAGAPRLLRTGDLGRFDAEGYLMITGRIKDVIIRGGENISPALIEGVVTGMPGIAACCVVGAPDEDLGETPVIFVHGNGDAAPDAAAIQAEVLARLGRIYVPRDVIWVDRLPENAVGKVDRKALARQAAGRETVQ